MPSPAWQRRGRHPLENQAEAASPFLTYTQKSHSVTSVVVYSVKVVRSIQIQGVGNMVTSPMSLDRMSGKVT